MNWLEQLPTLDVGVPALFPETESAAKPNANVVPDQPTSYTRRHTKLMHQEQRARNAAAAITEIPPAGHSLHGILNGGWDVWTVVPRTLELIAPAVIAEINISTLGYSAAASAELAAMMDAGQVHRATFLCSHYFKSHYGDVVGATARDLAARGGRFAICRTHAKVICIETSDDRWLTFEGSGNLRACRNVEQFAFIHDRGLVEFHRRWMMEFLDQLQDAK